MSLSTLLLQKIEKICPPCASALQNRLVLRAGRLLLWSLGTIYFAFVITVLVLRYSILPNIEDYRPHIERLVSEALQKEVRIGRIEASWEGINPDLTLHDISILDAEKRPAFSLSKVELILSWLTLPARTLKLHLLRIEAPTLHIRRDPTGELFIAGIPLAKNSAPSAGGKGGGADALLGIRRLRIQGAALIWEDEARQAPPLMLSDINMGLDNDGPVHRFSLSASPPATLATRLELRGEFQSKRLEGLDEIIHSGGALFLEVDRIHLAAWTPWIDYPLALPHGEGALRLWAQLSEGALQSITADLMLKDTALQLAPSLPKLDIATLSGRLSGKRLPTGFRVSATQFALESPPVKPVKTSARRAPPEKPSPALQILPTDFSLEWDGDDTAPLGSGTLQMRTLNLTAFAKLSEYLPLTESIRAEIKRYSPKGEVQTLDARWKTRAGALETYSLNTQFNQLALTTSKNTPGFSGLSGTLEVSERGGRARIASQAMTLDLPMVFPEPLIKLNELNADLQWTHAPKGLSVTLSTLTLNNADLAANLSGKYETTETGPGKIDLTGDFSRIDAKAIWRYMPLATGKNTRKWLQESLLSGKVVDTQLSLKGDLSHFPFLDKTQGNFLVTGKADNIDLSFAERWPRINNIGAELRFEGQGMMIKANRGTIVGTRITETQVNIADFNAPSPVLTINGQVSGATADFLKFIDQSPVSGMIDHATKDMRAQGPGRLDITLTLPLNKADMDDTKVSGSFYFNNNELLITDALPPLQRVKGSLQFSDVDLQIPSIQAQLFGGGLSIKGGSQQDGRILIVATGLANLESLKTSTPASPLFAYLTGSTPYRATISAGKKESTILIESSLQGVTSTLPAPFAKNANDPLPVRVEKRPLPRTKGDKQAPSASQEQILISLGQLVSLELVRQKDDMNFSNLRGAGRVGETTSPTMRGQDLVFNIAAPSIDLDEWIRLVSDIGAAIPQSAANTTEPSVAYHVNLKTPVLKLFGDQYTQAEVSTQFFPNQWKIRARSQEATGELLWQRGGRGKLVARLQKLILPTADKDAPEKAEGDLKDLPELDIIVDDFAYGKIHYGRLTLQAKNELDRWHINKLALQHPFWNLDASGQWVLGENKNETSLDFSLSSPDVGQMLDRLSYVGLMKRGSATLQGSLKWHNAPTRFELASLQGKVTLTARKGQFEKIDPGAGKLIGLLSLQSIPRRISLDFRDIFSEGFAFDTIEGLLTLNRGELYTKEIVVEGPAALISMQGTANLVEETQKVLVKIRPEVGSTAAIGVAFVNPVAGVATFLANKVLQNPIGQIFSFEYTITGTWADPKVEKLRESVESVPLPTEPGRPIPNIPALETSGTAPALNIAPVKESTQDAQAPADPPPAPTPREPTYDPFSQ